MHADLGQFDRQPDPGWAPPDAGWPRARPDAGPLEWVWAVGVSSLAHGAAYAALVYVGGGAAVQSWSAAPGLSSIELVMSPDAAPSPETGEPNEELAATVEVTVPGEAAPRGAEYEATAGAIERIAARLGQRPTIDEASTEPPAPEVQLAKGERAGSTEPRDLGTPPDTAQQTTPRPVSQPNVPSSASQPQAASRANQGVDALPQAIKNPAPTYPPDLLAARIEGRVVLRVLVRADGTVGDASVHISSGRPAFDAAALASIRHWRFKPAVRNGVAVEHSIAAPIRFVIER